MLGGERREGAVGVGIELNEDVIPDLDAARLAGVDQGATGRLVVSGQEVEVNLGARAAGASVAHHPKIVLLATVNDVDLWIKALGCEDAGPDVIGFLVERGRIALGRVRLVDGREEPLRRNTPDPRDQLPAPGERLLLEIVAKRPVAEHLEKRVVGGVEADILEVVVLATSADAFLGVSRAGILRGLRAGPPGDVGLPVAEKDRHELVHAGVGEKQAGRAGQQRGRRHDGVVVLRKKIKEALADFSAGHCE